MKIKRAPSHLSKESKKIWKDILFEFSIDDVAGYKLLETSLEALDRCQAARKQIDLEGMQVDGKKHCLLQTERDSRAAFFQGIKTLNLDLEPLKDRVGRP